MSQIPLHQLATTLKISLWFVLLHIMIAGCEDTPLMSSRQSVQEFIIPAGEHYATPKLLETVESARIAFRATFDKSALYDLADPSLQSNINKLMGFSDCDTHHHQNSARFGWRWFENRLEIHAYCYIDSVRVNELVAIVNPDEENLYEISAQNNAYIFLINGEKKTEVSRAQACDIGLKYKLYPYFGGSIPAPHDVHIRIEMVE